MKIGIIGSSLISEKFCATVNHLIERSIPIELTANYSRNLDTALKFAATNKISHSYDDKQQMLKTVDVVYIATPNSCHYEDIKLCLAYNCHVLVEKPMTISASQTSELFTLARQSNLILMEAIKTCSMNTYQHLITNIEAIGTITSFHLNMMRSYENFPNANSDNIANIYRQQMQGGVIADLGSYALFPLIDFIYPDYQPEQLTIATTKDNAHLDVEVNISSQISAPNSGPKGQITLAMNEDNPLLSTIVGTNGIVTIDSLSQFNQVCYYDLDHNLINSVNRPSEPLMTTELLNLIEMINNNQLASVSHNPEKSIKVANLMEILYK